jgi:LuxR family maltose regulon positive regulatory protein
LAPALIEPLSDREVEVLRLIADGLSNREIADRLVIATSTVKSHANHIYGKLGVRSRTQAIAMAQDLGLI